MPQGIYFQRDVALGSTTPRKTNTPWQALLLAFRFAVFAVAAKPPPGMYLAEAHTQRTEGPGGVGARSRENTASHQPEKSYSLHEVLVVTRGKILYHSELCLHDLRDFMLNRILCQILF